MRRRRPNPYQQQREALEIGKLRLMMIERVVGDLCCGASFLLGPLDLRAAVASAAAGMFFAARSRRP
jgi:hypothetical protein